MIEIIIDREQINHEALDSELRNTFGAVFIGISTLPNRIVLFLADESTQTQRSEARRLALNHDPARLTPEQTLRLARRQRLTQLRDQNKNSTDLEPDDYSAQLPLIRTLAQKIAWLEQEIHALRNQ